MSNFASIRFTVNTAANNTLSTGVNWAVFFDDLEIKGQSWDLNDFTFPYLRFKTVNASPNWLDWAPNLVNLINTYYAGTLGYKIVATLNSTFIEISATEFGHYFDYEHPNVIDVFIPPQGVITAEFIDPNITITEITAEQAASSRNIRCKFKIKAIDFTAPNHIVTIPYGGFEESFVDPYCFLDYYRNTPNTPIQLMDGAGKLSQAVNLPSVTEWKIDSVITTGSTAIIAAVKTVNGVIDTTITYSINGSLYQASNNFANLTSGTYTAYILDSLGGIWTKTFYISNIENVPAPFIGISDVNSIQFRQLSQSGNPLALFAKQKFINQERVCFAQTFKDDFLATTQIRTSYANIAIDIDGAPYLASKVVENLDQLDWRDCQFANGGTNKTLVYFSVGNIYNPSNGNIIGTFNNNSVAGLQLETWQKTGIKLDFTFGSFLVSDTVFSNDVGGMCLVIDSNFLSFVPEICKATYNKEEWDVYQFIVDMGLLDKTIEHTATIVFSDPNYLTDVWQSEPFYVTADEDNQLMKFEAWGDAVISDMMPTGIIHTIYMEAILMDSDPFQDIETMNSDIYDSIKVSSNYDQGFTISTNAIAVYLMHKLNLLSLFENILIDGLPYAIDKDAKIEFWNEKRNPLVLVKRSVRANKTSNSNQISQATSRVLGASQVTVLGA